MTNELSKIINTIKERLDLIDSIRNESIKISRDIIRLSGWSITELLKNNIQNAETYLEKCREQTKVLLNLTKPYPELRYSGFLYNAVSEYVEAEVFYNILVRSKVPSHQELGVPEVPYLQGLGDVVGELRRYILELLNKEEFSSAERLFTWMEVIYGELKGLDYPDALLPGVRKKVDVARRLIDDTKAFLIDMKTRRKLIYLLENVEGAR